jgi:hypothetical protein
MKKLTASATAVFLRLVDGLGAGEARTPRSPRSSCVPPAVDAPHLLFQANPTPRLWHRIAPGPRQPRRDTRPRAARGRGLLSL